jgi:hypothetical protein
MVVPSAVDQDKGCFGCRHRYAPFSRFYELGGRVSLNTTEPTIESKLASSEIFGKQAFMRGSLRISSTAAEVFHSE